MYKKIIVIIVLGTLFSLISGCKNKSNANENEILIGSIMPISGQISTYGIQSKNGINLAVKEINANGGVLGKKLRVITEDDEAIPEKSLNAFTKLVTQDKVVGIVGALTSKCSLAINQEAQKRKILMISPASTNDSLTEAGDYIFRACYNDSFQGDVIAKFAAKNLKLKKAAIIFDNSNDYSKGLCKNFKKKFKLIGGKIVAEESYGTSDKDFTAQLTKIKSKDADVLFIPDYYTTVSLIAKQVRSLGIKIPMLGSDGWDEIINNAGDEIVNSYYCNHYSVKSDDADVIKFIKAYRAEFENVPNALAALAYDSMYIFADAIEKAGSTEPEKIKDAMNKTDKKLVTGHIKFNKDRNPIKSAVILKIEKGNEKNKPQLVYFGTVDP